ncbi:GNAT family N-acetyltransferase [Alicyclobacillus dauci]|uniref:GNAT family N-acetyltransferase n=1 Tax=Alicyclobacillus dauci TaxID=1475485 RepID=A0ABY6Z4S8_9BACL|nr:GNAT family N-acetyltransferase [Alicyclobacillus dauci]WAH37663.1 GNAT family N-acetyltransferase [Alicyclobacillus dauci]
MKLRYVRDSDYNQVRGALNDWWGGRQMTHLLPRLFFEHFQRTSLVIEEGDVIVAFLVGFVSQTHQNEAYIHFVGVHPDYRRDGLGRRLYETFFDTVRHFGCDTVRCITSPVNTGSIAYHERMGFTTSFVKDYAGPGEDRVLFVKHISQE